MKNFAGVNNKINEFLIEELEFKESKLNKYITNKALNLILNNLSNNRRLEFYKFISLNKLSSAKLLLKKEIPNFNYLLFLTIKNELKQIL